MFFPSKRKSIITRTQKPILLYCQIQKCFVVFSPQGHEECKEKHVLIHKCWMTQIAKNHTKTKTKYAFQDAHLKNDITLVVRHIFCKLYPSFCTHSTFIWLSHLSFNKSDLYIFFFLKDQIQIFVETFMEMTIVL